MSLVGVHQPADTSSVQLNRVRFAVVATVRVDQKTEDALVRANGTNMPAPPEVQDIEVTHRHGEIGNLSTSQAIEGNAQDPSPRIDLAALPQSLYMAVLEGRPQFGYFREYAPHPQAHAIPNMSSSTRPPLLALNLLWGKGVAKTGLKPSATLIPEFQWATEYGCYRLDDIFSFANIVLFYRGAIS